MQKRNLSLDALIKRDKGIMTARVAPNSFRELCFRRPHNVPKVRISLQAEKVKELQFKVIALPEDPALRVAPSHGQAVPAVGEHAVRLIVKTVLIAKGPAGISAVIIRGSFSLPDMIL